VNQTTSPSKLHSFAPSIDASEQNTGQKNEGINLYFKRKKSTGKGKMFSSDTADVFPGQDQERHSFGGRLNSLPPLRQQQEEQKLQD